MATDMGAQVVGDFGFPVEVMVPVGDVAAGIVKVLGGATKETLGGKVVLYNGEIQGW